MKKFLISLSKIKFVRDIATMQVGQIITTGSGFLSSILFARLLGLEGYGAYAIVLAFTGLLGFVTNLGQYGTSLTFLAEAYGKKDAQKIKHVLQYYFFVSGCSTIVILILLPLMPLITKMVYGNAEIGQLARIILLSSIIDPLFIFGSIFLQSIREIRTLTILENSRIVLQLGISVLLLIQGMGVKGILLGTLLGTALMSVVAICMYIKKRRQYAFPSLTEILCFHQISHIWKLGKDGVWIAIDKNIGNLYPNIFMVILGIHTSESVVGLFRLAFKLGNLPTSFVLNNISRLSASVIPTLSGDGAKMKKILKEVIFYSACIHIGATACSLIVIPVIIPIVYGEAYKVAMYPFFVIAILHTSSVLHVLMTPILRLYSRIYIATAFNIIAFIFSIGIFYLLMERVRVTFALYISLGTYQMIILLLVFPVYFLVQKQQQSLN